MESFHLEGDAGRRFRIQVDEVTQVTPELVHTLIEIDLQTFSEHTFSQYTAAAMLQNGRVYLLKANDAVIGTCVCMRSWGRPNEAMILSMGIRPGFRGRGLGQHFVGGVIERLEAKGLRSVSLLVGGDNRRAIKLYEDVGFEVVDDTMVDRTGETLMLMRLTLQDDPVVSLPPQRLV